ncbi:hypothetical protein E3_1300 [Rhodococcus phage E3]|uniref:hypothetical protein n=1 Tax=Rhodococcus phage E3 TaxID=1007869 RepID=UPI0002C6D739|nr:hypothetical protein M176_gp137 [Rhodococcus phage E3]AEQ21045.1 hypothetical protein E3_1300 [Rhodococcus phage E3]
MSRTDIQVPAEGGVRVYDAGHMTFLIKDRADTARNFLLAAKGLRETIYAPDDCLVRGLKWAQSAVRYAEIRHSDPRVNSTEKSLLRAKYAARIEAEIREHAAERGLELP